MKPSLTLGFNFFGGHDTSVFAIFPNDCYGLSQERLTRIKHDSIFPIDALKEMLRFKKIDPKTIKHLHVGIATKAFQKRPLHQESYQMSLLLRKLLQTKKKPLYIKEFTQEKERLQNAPLIKKLTTFLAKKEGRAYLFKQLKSKKRPLEWIIQYHLKEIFPNAKLNISFYDHHLCHAYGAYYSSTFNNTLLLTFDGEGDGYFSKIYHVSNGTFKELGSSPNCYVENLKEYDFADNGYSSIGNLYSIFTHLLGFTPHADEGKVEALAAFGNAQNSLYKRLKAAHSIDKEHLCIQIDSQLLNQLFAKESLQKIFHTLSKEDIAAAIQHFLEQILVEYLSAIKKRYPDQNLILSGGVTANVIANMKIFEKLFKHLFIQPAMGDEGVAQGACIQKYLAQYPDQKEHFRFPLMPYYGSSYTKEEIEKALSKTTLSYQYLAKEAYTKAAEQIIEGKIGALFQGRCEFGPRALGNRTIIADVRNKEIQKHINQQIKKRPLFQPFCPTILEEERKRLFKNAYPNKHMTIAFKLKEQYSEAIPGAIHVDQTARVQFLEKEDNPNYYALLKRVQKLTGYGVVINTSFNKHGRTMVLTPSQAIEDFIDTNLDFMVMDGYFVTRGD